MPSARIILASRSPRRYELLQQIVPMKMITVFASDIVESILPGEDVFTYSKRIAFAKANNVLVNMTDQNPADIILGADTIIDLDHEVIGKPYDNKSAYKILIKLRGQWHKVITGVCLLRIRDNYKKVFTVCSEVLMRRYSDAEIENYVKTNESLDKAGAYAIQGKGKAMVQEYKGSYTNIVGLPVDEIATELRGMDCRELLL